MYGIILLNVSVFVPKMLLYYIVLHVDRMLSSYILIMVVNCRHVYMHEKE